MSLGIILLAAGSSSRMGRSKQMLEINGEPLLLHAATAALQSSVGPVIAVLGAQEDDHRKIIKHLDVTMVSNPNWETGMGSSLKTGLNYWISQSPQSEGVVVMLCDQPLLTAEYLKRLADTFTHSGKPIVASWYANAAGVPVVFRSTLFAEILQLPDDHGAKKIIARHSDQAHNIDFQGGAVDLDTREDYEQFVNRYKR